MSLIMTASFSTTGWNCQDHEHFPFAVRDNALNVWGNRVLRNPEPTCQFLLLNIWRNLKKWNWIKHVKNCLTEKTEGTQTDLWCLNTNTVDLVQGKWRYNTFSMQFAGFNAVKKELDTFRLCSYLPYPKFLQRSVHNIPSTCIILFSCG